MPMKMPWCRPIRRQAGHRAGSEQGSKPSDIIFDAGVLSPTNVIRWSDGTLVEVSDSRKIRISLKPKESELLLVDQER